MGVGVHVCVRVCVCVSVCVCVPAHVFWHVCTGVCRGRNTRTWYSTQMPITTLSKRARSRDHSVDSSQGGTATPSGEW